MSSLKVNEIFGPTIQGEGPETGLSAIFVRFSGCNKWSGKPEDREKSACPYCDTDFLHGNEMTPQAIFEVVEGLSGGVRHLVVFTGGEPLLQNLGALESLVARLKAKKFITQLETNGSLAGSSIIQFFDRITVSPKQPLKDCHIDFSYVTALKFLIPHPVVDESEFLEAFPEIKSVYFQPIDPVVLFKDVEEEKYGKAFGDNLGETMFRVKQRGYPVRLGVQIHKIVGQQ